MGHHMPEDWNLQTVDVLQEIGGFEDGSIMDGIILTSVYTAESTHVVWKWFAVYESKQTSFSQMLVSLSDI
jgi:hypothetical protein